jgi:hypothetical protein
MKSILLLFSLIITTSFRVPNVLHPIYLKECDFYLYPEKGCKNVYNKKINDSSYININLYSCKGNMYVKLYVDSILVEEGKYINSLDLLKKYNNRVGFSRKYNKPIAQIFVSSYYQPLRDSIWTFYKEDSVIRKVYRKGILQ